MAKVVGDIAVKVGADVAGLQKGMRRAGKSVKGFDNSAAKMGARFAKVGVGVGLAAAGMAAAFVSAMRSASEVGTEIANLSRIAGISTTEFQRLAIASESVQIGQEKLADIVKDVNDKFGDFMATGAGPLADFFENIAPAVGVTAEQFARLSGPEALQLYVTSLERAGVSQQQMTFYMEALASDATALLPLLRDNGRELSRLGDEAAAAGRILSTETVEGAQRVDAMLRELSGGIRAESISALIALEDELAVLAQFFTDVIVPAIAATVEMLAKLASAAMDAAQLMAFLRDPGAAVGGTVADNLSDLYGLGDGANSGPEGAPGALEDLYGIPGPLQLDIPGPSIPLVNRAGTTGGGRTGGGGAGRDFDEEMEALRDRFRTEYEIIQEEFDAQLAQLQEFRDAKVATEEEYNELEARIRQDHADRMAAIEQATQRERLSAISGAFGDLATLMQTSNEKLFKIGKIAAIAEATVSGYQAAVDAWQKGMKIGGPGLAAAFTAASLARTGALIAGIQAQSATGGGGAGGTAGGGSAAAPVIEPQVSRHVAIQLVGGDNYSAGQVRDLINALNQEVENGAILRLV